MAAALPSLPHGWIEVTRYRPRQPIRPGNVSGKALNRRSQLRRTGNPSTFSQHVAQLVRQFHVLAQRMPTNCRLYIGDE
jgi:hypothetical protein